MRHKTKPPRLHLGDELYGIASICCLLLMLLRFRKAIESNPRGLLCVRELPERREVALAIHVVILQKDVADNSPLSPLQ